MVAFHNLQRLFTWTTTGGSFIRMASDVNAFKQSVVYKCAIGEDKDFVSIFTDRKSAAPFDFVVSNDTVYFANGHVAKAWHPVNGLRAWGIKDDENLAFGE